MEATVERFSFWKLAKSLGAALVGDSAQIIYCVAIFLTLCAIAIKNGNNTFIWGVIVAVIAFTAAGTFFGVDDAYPSKSSEFFERQSGIAQFFLILALPVIILLLSSCMIICKPSVLRLYRSQPVAVIENVKTNRMTATAKRELFFPGAQRVHWFFLQRDLETSGVFTTRDGKAVQADISWNIQFAGDNDSIENVYSRYGPWGNVKNVIEDEISATLERIFLRYELSALPSEAAIEEMIVSEANFKKLHIQSAACKAEVHRQFALKINDQNQ